MDDNSAVGICDYIIKNLVSNPDSVNIDIKSDDMGTLLSIKVHKDDMGILIGRNGIMANSIKTLIKAIGKTKEENLRVQFLEPDGSTKKKKTDDVKIKPKAKTTPVRVAKDKPDNIPPAGDLDSEFDEFIIN